jgi:glycosyltransferase involved in cell wall biosynthesis
MDLVSIVIPCYNPDASLLEAIGSARSQTYANVEIIIVDDGSSSNESRAILGRAARDADRYIEQSNRGVAAARNAGVRAASGSFFVPLDCEDVLKPDFVAACLAAIQRQPSMAFVYTDYRVFGKRNYTERLRSYNLYDLLETNTLPYASLIRTEDWFAAGGYDETFIGYEDWEFWLRLGARGRFGHHLDRVLWAYRKQGRSLSDVAGDRHDELVARIRSKHPVLYGDAAYAQIKTRWKPAICVAGQRPRTDQTICDWEALDLRKSQDLLTASGADTFLFPKNGMCDPQSLELSALAALGRREPVLLPDGSMAVPRAVLARCKDLRDLKTDGIAPRRMRSTALHASPLRFLETICRHLNNAELLSTASWLKHPIRSLSRLIPLRLKETLNQKVGRPVFDLTFYLRFQPRSLVLGKSLVSPVRYIPRQKQARRVALVTPHLGVGGAETVLLDIAAALDKSRYEILLIATHSTDSRWLTLWRDRVHHIYDLHNVISGEHLGAAMLSIIGNWGCDTLLVQNALPCYDIMPILRRAVPGMMIMDMVHGGGEDWSVLSCTAGVADHIQRRVVVSEWDRKQLVRAGVPEERIRLIRNGIDLARFTCAPEHEPRALLKQRRRGDFLFVVAGDGPEEAALRSAVIRSGIDHLFEFRGYVSDMAPVFADSALLIITSRSEGIPLVLLEALASGKPVVASNVGAIGELLDEETGFLIDCVEGEADAFASAIHMLLAQPELRARMGRIGRRKVEADYDRRRSMQCYRELFGYTPPDFARATAVSC